MTGGSHEPKTHVLTLPSPMLRRGFWLYVWRVKTPSGHEHKELLYIGRTGDNSSPNAAAPFTRMGQHLGFAKNQNSLRRLLIERGVAPEECSSFDLISHGPLYPEVERPACKDERQSRRDELFELHLPFRDRIGALEKHLAKALKSANYSVMNSVSWKHDADPAEWERVKAAFTVHFPRLADVT